MLVCLSYMCCNIVYILLLILLLRIINNNGFIVGIISGIISSVLVTIFFKILNYFHNKKKLKVIFDYLFKLINNKHIYQDDYKYLLVLYNNDFEIIYNELNKVFPIASTYLEPDKINVYMNYYNILSELISYKRKVSLFNRNLISKFNIKVEEYLKTNVFTFDIKSYSSDIEAYISVFRDFIRDNNKDLVEHCLQLDDYLKFVLYYQVLINVEYNINI